MSVEIKIRTISPENKEIKATIHPFLSIYVFEVTIYLYIWGVFFNP